MSISCTVFAPICLISSIHFTTNLHLCAIAISVPGCFQSNVHAQMGSYCVLYIFINTCIKSCKGNLLNCPCHKLSFDTKTKLIGCVIAEKRHFISRNDPCPWILIFVPVFMRPASCSLLSRATIRNVAERGCQ